MGESFSVRLAAADKMLFGEENVPYELYANQHVPLWKEASIWDKLATDGRYNQLITGGGIVHAQVGETLTEDQYLLIILYSIAVGCEHFALNAVFSVCENNHSTMGKHKTCPECGSDIVDFLTRVVGFFTKVSAWGKVKKTHDFPNRTFVDGSFDMKVFSDSVMN